MSKENLKVELQKFGLETEGTAEELRKRMVGFIEVRRFHDQARRNDELPVQEEPTMMTTDPVYLTAARAPVHLCEIVRKWNVCFDGKTDPVAFLERVEELNTSYNI